MARTKKSARTKKIPLAAASSSSSSSNKKRSPKKKAAPAVKQPTPSKSNIWNHPAPAKTNRQSFLQAGAKIKTELSLGVAATKKNKKNKTKKPLAVEVLPLTKKQRKDAKKKKKQQQQQQQQQQSSAQQQQQQVQLPAKRLIGQGRIPWIKQQKNAPKYSLAQLIDLTCSDDCDRKPAAKSNNNNSKKRGIRLPTDDADTVLMEQFSNELRAFGDYARLTEAECQARQALLDQMQQVAVRVFQNSPEVDTTELELQVFGSYACPAVCTFQSDVDCALWGAVYPKKKTTRTPNQINKVSNSSTQQEDPQTVRKQKWRLALAMMDEENGLTPDHRGAHTENTGDAGDDVAKPQGDVAVTNDSSVVSNTNKEDSVQEEGDDQDDMPLFVLDRTGVVDLTEDDSVAPNDESDKNNNNDNSVSQVTARSTSVSSTQATVTESESSESDAAAAKTETEEMIDISSDDDTADKLTESRLRGTAAADSVRESTTADEPHAFTIASSGSESDNEEEEEESDQDDMAVHCFHRAAETSPSSSSTEPSDFSRRKVIDGLQRYFKGLRNSGMSRNIQLISRARVPIIKMESRLGVEVDCSIGGMNGADTSLYAFKMSQKYQSFGPVVVALKVIMSQQNLDVPFNGGLGSYKLYVLVASHIAKHVELGGRDDPGEIFLSFLFRYGESVGHHHTHRDTRTFVSQDDVISCNDGGKADLSNVFLIKDCRSLFGSLWRRLWGCLRKTGKSATTDSPRASFLAEVIHTTWLDHKRQMNIANAQDFVKKQNNKESPRRKPKRQSANPTPTAAGRWPRELTEDELIAGYNGRPAKKAKTVR